MIKIRLFRRYAGAQAAGATSGLLLLKTPKSLLAYSTEDFSVTATRRDSSFATKILVSPDGQYALAFSSLLSERETVLSLPHLTPILQIFSLSAGQQLIFRDATFSSDNHTLYFLADSLIGENAESVLIVVSLPSREIHYYFQGQGLRFDSLRYSEDKAALCLFAQDGQMSFFRNEKIIAHIHCDPFHRLFFIEKGALLLMDSPTGFRLCSHNGTVLHDASFLPDFQEPAPKNGTADLLPLVRTHPVYVDMTFSREKNLIFYLAKVPLADESHLFVFTLKDLSLVSDTVIPEETWGLNYRDPFLIVKGKENVSVYRMTDTEKGQR